ncbi:ESPR-type extended signal peptide-containing protein, partial [Acinetobacter sp. HY1485]|uniref:ESPR-type extended signal peptide-containing protein n=1 Tax=Acinetobacter sp. HY1485 TaxID=2970918 RepID=UPI0022B9C097
MNKIYKVIWNATLGAWVVASELGKSHKKTTKTVVMGTLTTVMSITFAPQASANIANVTLNGSASCAAGTTQVVYSRTINGTKAQATDGSGTYSTVIGCSANGNNNLAVTAYGALANTTGDGGAAFGFNASAAKWAVATGIDSLASGVGAIATGAGTTSSGASAVAIGQDSTASGANSTAIGKTAVASGSDSIAMGTNSKSATTSSVAIGLNTDTTGTTRSVAIGEGASTAPSSSSKTNGQSVAIGSQAKAPGDQSVAIGNDVKATGNSSVVIGGDDVNSVIDSSGSTFTAITGKTLTKSNYVATEAGEGGTAVGVQSSAKGAFASALGLTANASGDASVALGTNSQSTGKGALAIGAVSNASQQGSIAVGINSTSSGTNATAIGSGSTSGGGAQATGENATAIGSGSSASANGTAIGTGSKATQAGGVAIGTNSVSNVASGVAGYDPITGKATTDTTNTWKSTQAAVAVGDTSNNITRQISGLAAGTNDSDAVNVAQLKKVKTYADNLGTSTATNLGGGSTLDTTTGKVTAPSYSVNGSNVTNVGAAITALDKGWTLQTDGANAAAVKAGDTVDIGVASGEKNIVVSKSGNTIDYSLNPNLNVTSVVAGNSTLNNNGLTIANGPSVTSSGISAANKTISNVAAGALSSTSTDAVNGTQLNQTNQNVTAAQNAATAAQATADKGLSFVGNTGTAVNKKLGQTLTIKGNGSKTDDQYSANNIKTTVDSSGNIVVMQDKNSTFDSITTGDSVLSSNGLSITNGPSITKSGINANSTKITNLANGTDDNDAVNKSQLTTVEQAAKDSATNLANSTASGLGGGATYDATTGKISNPIYSVNGTSVNNVGDAITALDKGWNLQSNGNQSAAVKAGDTVDIGTADGEKNLVVDKSGNNIKYSLSRTLDVDSVTAGDTVISTNGLVIDNGPSVTKSGISGGGQTVSNIANGELSSTSTDAVTGSQLNQTNENVTAAQATADKGLSFTGNTGIAVNKKLGETLTIKGSGTKTDDQYSADNIKTTVDSDGNIIVMQDKNSTFDSIKTGDTTLSTNGLAIANGPSITQSGLNANNTQITNLADGTSSTDAVNKGQLDSIANTLSNKGLNFTANTGNALHKNLDETLGIVGEGEKDATEYSAKNIKTRTDDNGNIVIMQDKNSSFDSITTGNSKLDTNGLKITNGPSITTSGIDANNTKITNVAAGTNSTDAVNKNQLDQATKSGDTKNNNLGTSTAANLGGGATYNSSTGTISSPTYTVNGASVNNVGDAISKLDQGFDLFTNGAYGTTIKAGDTIDIGTVDGEKNLEVTKTGNTIKYNLKRDLDLDSVQVGNTAITSDGLSINNGPSITQTGINANNTTVSNVAAGQKDTDAVNKKQLDTLSTTLTNKGLSFTGNSGNTVSKKLGETLTVKGTGTKADDQYSANNIKTTTDANGNLVVMQDRNSTFDSVTADDGNGNSTVLNTSGTTVKDASGNTANYGAKTTSLTDGTNTTTTTASGTTVDNGKTKTTVGADTITVGQGANPVVINGQQGTVTGLTNTNWDPSTVQTDRAATEGQVLQATSNLDGTVTQRGLNFAANSGDVVHKNLGETLTVKGTGTKADDQYSADNIKTTTDADGNLVVMQDRNSTFDSVTADDGNGNSTVLNTSGTTVKDASGNTANYGAKTTSLTDGTNTTTTTASGTTVDNGKTKTTVGADTITVGQGANPVVINGQQGTVTGLTNTNWDSSTVQTDRAATEGQVLQATSNLDGTVTQRGLNFAANSGDVVHKNLGETLTVKGTGTKADDQYSADNIKTTTDADGNLVVMQDRNSTFDSVTADDGNG